MIDLISALLGLFGTILITFFGVPGLVDHGGRSGYITKQVNRSLKRKILIYKILSNFGLFLVILSFCFQAKSAIDNLQTKESSVTIQVIKEYCYPGEVEVPT